MSPSRRLPSQLLLTWQLMFFMTLWSQVLGQLEASADCGTTKGCFSECSGTDCQYTISWSEEGNYGIYTLSTKTTQTQPWMAIGFSQDQIMGGDSVSGCLTANDGTVTIFNAENVVKTPTLFQDNDVTLTDNQLSNGIFTCTIRRLKSPSGNGKRFDITQNYYLLFATGATSNSAIQYHTGTRYFSPEMFSVTSRPDIGRTPAVTSPVGSATLPSDCGTARGCFSKCDGNTCDFITSWTESGDNAVYTLTLVTGIATPWMALGMSTDKTMGNDGVIGCGANANGDIILFSGRNNGKSAPAQFVDNEVTLDDSSFQDGVFSCSFTRPKAGSANGRVDANQKWNLLFAYETASFSGQTVNPSYHKTTKYISNAQYSASDRPNEGASELDFPLVTLHGCLMIGAWIFFASIGIVMARYYKPVWAIEMCSQKVWFQIHRTCMVLVFCTTVAGFITIFVEVEDWSELTEEHEYLEYHPILGVVVTSLVVLNPLMALFRPHPGTQHRPIFNWAHWFVGTSAHILGVITIFFGIQLTKADGPDYLVYILAGYVGWQVLVELTLEFIQCAGRKTETRSDAYELNDLNKPKPVSSTEESSKTLTIKKIILVLHIFVVASITAVLIGILIVGENELED